MSIQQLLLNVDDLHSFSEQSTFTQNIPVEWIEPALREYSDQNRLLETKVSAQARRKHPALPEKWQVRSVSYKVGSQTKTALIFFLYERYPTELHKSVSKFLASEVKCKQTFRFIAANLIVIACANPESKTGMRLTELKSGIANLFLESYRSGIVLLGR